MVADSVDELQSAPVDGTAAEILGWAERKHASDPDKPIPHLIFHALRKLNVIGDLDLVERPRLLAFLESVGRALAEASEPVDRERLRRLLERLGEEDMAHSGPVDGVMIEKESRTEIVDRPETPQTKQLSILEQRLRQEGLAKAPASDPVRRRVVSQALAAAATAARSEKDLKADLRRLREAGVAADAGEVFRGLGEGLGNWALPKEMAEKEEDLPRAVEVEAMEKIVSLPEDPIEIAKRFRHLVTTATEQFNEGHLGRAVQMIELALELVSGKKVESGYVDPVRKQGHEALDSTRLKEFMDKPDRHYQLRQVLEFFDPGLGVEALLDQLEVEERRDRRRLILDLLLIHGAPARAAARQRLWDSAETEVSDFARRNWVYLLRLIPRAEQDPVDPEIEAAARFGVPGMPLFLVKETVNFLGQTRHPTAARALMTLLGRWESFLSQADVDDDARKEGFAALDRLASAVARLGYPQGWQALLEHSLGRKPELGATVDRLSDLGSQDLSQSPEVVDRLLGEIEDSMPKGMLGRLVGRKDQDLPALVGALAGTRTAEVREALADVAERLGAQPAGQAARRAMRATAAGHSIDRRALRRDRPRRPPLPPASDGAGAGHRHADPAPGGRNDPGHDRLPSGSAGHCRLGSPQGDERRLPGFPAPLRRNVRPRSATAPGAGGVPGAGGDEPSPAGVHSPGAGCRTHQRPAPRPRALRLQRCGPQHRPRRARPPAGQRSLAEGLREGHGGADGGRARRRRLPDPPRPRPLAAGGGSPSGG